MLVYQEQLDSAQKELAVMESRLESLRKRELANLHTRLGYPTRSDLIRDLELMAERKVRRPRQPKDPAPTPSVNETVFRLTAEGYTVAAISRKTGLSPAKIRQLRTLIARDKTPVPAE